MTADPEVEKVKVGAIVYLPDRRLLQLADLGSDFRSRWPGIILKSLGTNGPRVHLRVGQTDLTIEVCKSTVPVDVTNEALVINRGWPEAGVELAKHESYITVRAMVDRARAIAWAEDLTRLLCSVVSISSAIGVCWLNGPVMTSGKEFVALAAEMFGNGVPPLMLWVATVWKPEAGFLYTKGMQQFDSPEIFLSHQKKLSMEMGMYLLEVAYYVLASGKELLDGETIDGPSGTLQISTLSGEKSGKQGRMLTPIQPN